MVPVLPVSIAGARKRAGVKFIELKVITGPGNW
jgi:hypothetical protein